MPFYWRTSQVIRLQQQIAFQVPRADSRLDKQLYAEFDTSLKSVVVIKARLCDHFSGMAQLLPRQSTFRAAIGRLAEVVPTVDAPICFFSVELPSVQYHFARRNGWPSTQDDREKPVGNYHYLKWHRSIDDLWIVVTRRVANSRDVPLCKGVRRSKDPHPSYVRVGWVTHVAGRRLLPKPIR